MPVVKGAVTSTTSRSRSPSLEPEVNEEMLTPSKEHLSVDEEEDWWSANLEEGRRSLR